ncbi:hypothetical protein XELAEV_18013923mg, partial [Xenopus laevis]
MIILTAFLCGLNNIYVNYPESQTLGKRACRFICCSKPKKRQDYPPIATISNREVDGGISAGESRALYRLQVIKALVQRYIDTARREFEESRRKDLGNRITELNKNVIRLQSEVKNLRRSVVDSTGSGTNKSNENVLSQYIMKVKGSFQSYDQVSINSSKESSE